jgi:hypothetical protein
LRANPKISVCGLGNRVGCASKNAILNPPCAVPVLRNLPVRIECVERMGKAKKDEAGQKHPRDVELRYLEKATHE